MCVKNMSSAVSKAIYGFSPLKEVMRTEWEEMVLQRSWSSGTFQSVTMERTRAR